MEKSGPTGPSGALATPNVSTRGAEGDSVEISSSSWDWDSDKLVPDSDGGGDTTAPFKVMSLSWPTCVLACRSSESLVSGQHRIHQTPRPFRNELTGDCKPSRSIHIQTAVPWYGT